GGSFVCAPEPPHRVDGVVFMSGGPLLSPGGREIDNLTQQILPARDVPIEALPAMNYFNREAWQRDPETYRSFLIWFFETFFEEHSTKQIEDAIGWGLETDGNTLAATHLGPQIDAERTHALCARIQCPTLVIHGTGDRITPFAEGEALAAALGTRLEAVDGSGHGPMARKPVQVNHAVREFLEPGFAR